MNKNTITSLGYVQASESVPALSSPPSQPPLATISVTDVPLSESPFNDGQNEGSMVQDDDNYGVFGNTLTEPVEETIKRDLFRILSNLKLVVLPNPFREDPGKALRDWDLWGPFFFIVFLGLTLSWSASIEKAEVFAVAFAGLASGAVVLTMNIALLGGRINLFQSMSLLGYCLFPLDVGAVLCFLLDLPVMWRMWVVLLALAWSCWAAYPFMSIAVHQSRKALALYPVLLMYVFVAFLIIA